VDDYLPILILLILGFLFAAVSFVASALLAPKKRPTAAKIAPYECGIVPEIEPPTRFPVRFYLIAMIFIIFDIEIVFLYPWAVIFRQLGSFGLIEVVVFAAVVFVSFLFLISNGALSWGPAKRLVGAMPSRTSESTIARISAGPGGPGRSTRSVGVPSPAVPAVPDTTEPDAPTTGEPATAPSGPGRAA
jgi:NADH-quinone oxidoreductase subunit A